MSSESGDGITRRRVLETGTAGLTALAAGCLGGDDSEPDPEQDTQEGTPGQDSETDTQDTGQDQEPEDYDTPESEHMDTQTLLENWGTTYSGHERDMIDSFSPSQVTGQYDTNWTEGNDSTARYDVLPFPHEDVPETLVQETPHDGNHNILKVDQLPSGASEEDVEAALEEDGYTKDSENGGFSIYTTVDEKEARAVGNGMHLVAFNRAGTGPASNVHMEHLNEALDDYRSDESGLHEDVQGLVSVLDIQDSFTAFRSQDLWTDLVSGYDPEEPSAGAVTVDFEDETKYAAWKFSDEETAQQAYEILSGSSAELENGFTQVDQDGEYLTAAGGYDVEGNFDWALPSSTPII